MYILFSATYMYDHLCKFASDYEPLMIPGEPAPSRLVFFVFPTYLDRDVQPPSWRKQV